MSLHDNYGIIENHLINENTKTIISKIENYFENYLNSDIKVLVDDYINQSIWFNKIDMKELIINIQNLIKNYLIERRNNIRSFIKKGIFELSDLNKFLKNFLKKINYLYSTFNMENLVQNSILQLNNLIISDGIILMFIEEQVIVFDNNIKELLLFIKKISLVLGNNENYIKIIKLFGNIYKKNIINIEELPIPINIRRIQKINNTIKYYNSIITYYKFIKEGINNLIPPIYKLILEELIEIIKFNSLHEIKYTFNNIWKYILDIIKYNISDYDKQSLLTSIITEIINKCSNTIISINEVETNIQLANYVSSLIKYTYYDKNNVYITNMSNTIINYFKPDDGETKIINFINSFINNAILNNNIDEVNTVILIVNHLNNIDIFINCYYDLLIKRLTNKINVSSVSEFEIYIQKEKEIIDTIYSKVKITCNKFYKINTIINDTQISFNENIEFNKLSNKLLNTKISVITTSFENWNINQTEGIIDNSILNTIKDTQLGKYLKYYELYYIEKYNNKKIINWFPHFGEINITYLNQKLKMFPIQFMVIEMFNNVEKILLKDIFNSKILSNYSEKFKTDIINSIIISELFIQKDEYIILSQLNNIKNDFIEIFLNNSEYPNIWEQLKQKELAYSRDEIINTIINHTLKTCSKSYSDLFLITNEKIKLFKLEDNILGFNKSLKYLIELDYIKLNDNNEYEKII